MLKQTLAAAVMAAAMITGADASAQTGGATASPGKARGKSSASSGPRVPKVLQRIAECESGGDPKAVSADGLYRGKYQFSRPTWRAYGGEGDPAAAPEAEQDRRAIKLYRAEGTAPWPNCG